MGWRGTLRSMAAASRRSAKNAERRFKEQQKIATLENATAAVTAWEEYLDGLLAIHVDLADAIDWQAELSASEPSKPLVVSHRTEFAQKSLAEFVPSVFHFLKGGSKKVLSKLEIALEQAKKDDETDFLNQSEKYQKDLAQYREDKILAEKILGGDITAQKSVLETYLTEAIGDFVGTSIEFTFSEQGVCVFANVHSDSIVPKFRRKVLASGKLSETPMPTAQFNELYQDYVASVALKLAGDVFHLLPVSETWVTCNSEMLNKANGHLEPTAILSVRFVRDTFKRLNLRSLDTSDCLALFDHRMSFTKKSGFVAVQPFFSDT